MSDEFFRTWGLALALAALPLAGGCDQQSAESAAVPVSTSTNQAAPDVAAITIAPTAEIGEMEFANAPGTIVSFAKLPPAASHLSSPASEIVKLAQAGVDESVMLSFVTNSPFIFDLNSEDIIYLNDIGVPGPVVTAMIVHDQSVKGSAPEVNLASEMPMYTNQLVLPPGTPTPYPETVMEETPGYDVGDYSEVSDESNASAGYFYDSLAPYGNWIDVSGYGLCWQPTVVVINPNWQPYCDRGHWVYSDCGWYWSSGYSWGWAPFHYGRWFCHSQWGWCWAPDTVWGPSWVTWRYSPGYCGWAPLPPTACYTPGIGISHNRRVVSTSFDFGLRADRFTFVAANRVLDTHLERHRLSLRGSRQIFNDSVVFNRITEGRNNTVVNEGIPIRHVAAATHSEIRRVHIREATDPANTRSEYIERDGTRSVAAFRPKLPQPTRSTVLVGESVRPAPRPAAAIRIGRTTRSEDNARRQQLTEANLNARDPGVEPSSTRDAGTPASSGRTSSIILRGPDRSMNPNAERAAAPPGSVILAGPRNANRASTPMVSATPTAPSMPAASSMPTTYPAQETSPVHYNPYNPPQVVVNPNQRQLFNLPTRQAPSPGQNQRANAGNDQRYPQYRQPEARAYTPPAPVVQVPQAQPVYQPPRAVEPPQQYRQANPAPQPQAPQPVVRSQPAPRSESRPAQPRQVESRPSPPPQPQQPAPQVRSDSGSSRPAPGTQSGGGGGAGGGRRNR